MNITETEVEGKYELSFVDNYVEESKIKQVLQAITKFVNRNVNLEVYYEGSSVPDKVTAKVRINP